MPKPVATLLISVFLLLPAIAFAQATASIAGTVVDASGALLPGVVVEAYLGPGPDAAISATLEALTMCVERGIDLNAFNTAGQTAMHVAAGRGLDPVVKFLAEHGARLDRTDKQGRTPLDVALGVGAGVARGGNNRNASGPRESTAVLLRQLMSASGRTSATLQ